MLQTTSVSVLQTPDGSLPVWIQRQKAAVTFFCSSCTFPKTHRCIDPQFHNRFQMVLEGCSGLYAPIEISYLLEEKEEEGRGQCRTCPPEAHSLPELSSCPQEHWFQMVLDNGNTHLNHHMKPASRGRCFFGVTAATVKWVRVNSSICFQKDILNAS